MGPPGSWGQGRGWSLARSEVEPAPFSWGSQIVAMQRREEVGVGACLCICPGSPKQAAPGPGIPSTRGLLPTPPPPHPPSWSHSSWPLLHIWPWTLHTALSLEDVGFPVCSVKISCSGFRELHPRTHPYLWIVFHRL